MTTTRAQSSNSPADDAERTSAPIFTPILPPRITSTSHAALVKWRKDRREYEDTIRNRAKGETVDLIVPIKNTFDEGLLRQWCRLRWKMSMSDVTDELILDEVEKIISTVKNNSVPDIDREMAEHLRMDLSESDVNERVIQYFKLCHEIIDDHGWRIFFTEDHGKKQLCSILTNSLEPKAFREEVDQTARFQTRKAKEDEVVLHDLILEKALNHEKAFLSQRRAKRDRDRGDHDAERPAQRSGGKKSTKKQRVADESSGSGPRPSPKGAIDHPKKPPTPCPHCGDLHWRSECTSATDSEKAEIRKKLRAQRSDGTKREVARLKRVRECIPDEKKTVTLNEVMKLPYCADTGADRTAISRKHVEELMLRDPAVKLTRLNTPMLIVGVAKHEIVCSASVQLRGLLNTAAGAVAIHDPVECLVIDDDKPEFILGQDLLKTLGIDVDRQLEQLVERDTDDGEDIADSDVVPVSDTPPTDGDLRGAVERLIQEALKHGFPSNLEEQLRAITTKHDIWCFELGNDPPARVKPLEIRLKEGSQAVKSKPRRYPPAVRLYLREFNRKLVDLGWVYENPQSRWVSPSLPVRKPGTTDDQYRQTCDYRLVNDLIEAMISTMPHMSALLEYTKGNRHYGLFDILKGFWQLPLAKLSQELMSYITDSKIYTPRRVAQGCCDAAVHFQQTMEECFEPLLYKCLIIGIDDLLLFADDIDNYLLKLEHFFDLVASFGLKLSAKKSSLYQKSVKWCGRIIDSNGISHDPERINTLRVMPYPTTAGQLQQFVCATNWMWESIVDYARAVEPLQQHLDNALRNGKRTKRAATGISIELFQQEKATYDRVKDLLATSATLVLPDDKATTCIFSDASDMGYAVVLTQVMDFDPTVSVTAQKHQLLTCLSGSFHGSQHNWTVIEKEAYPIVVACEKLDYLLLRPRPVHLFCDHRNLIHVFAPHTNIKKHIRGKLLRWGSNSCPIATSLSMWMEPPTCGLICFRGGQASRRRRCT